VSKADGRKRTTLDDKLDLLLGRRENVEAHLGALRVGYDRQKAELLRRHNEVATPLEGELEEIDAELAVVLERHHHWLTRRHGKTIERPNGEIKEVLRAREMDVPESEEPAIAFLRSWRGGEQYLTVSYKLNRTALRNAPAGLRAELRKRFGFWWGRHRTFSVKSRSSKAPKQLSRRRYNERS